MATSLEQYIRQAALARGIDPDIAVRVAQSEGGLRDPVRQSGVMKDGRQEPSYGPFQLLVGGEGTGFPAGMGNDALARGIDPRNPDHALRGVDFALDGAAKNGWGAWYGAKAAGIGNRDGIGAGAKGVQMAGMPAQMPAPGQMTAPILGGREIADRPVAGILAAPAAEAAATTPERSIATVFKEDGLKAGMASLLGDEKVGKNFTSLAKAFGGDTARDKQAEAHAVPMPSNISSFDAMDTTRMANAQQMMTQLLGKRKRVPGMSLMG